MHIFNPKTKKNSFVLIEIIIVLAVIGILTSLGLFGYTYFVEKARRSEAVIAAGNIRGAEIANKLDKGEYVGAGSAGEINNLLGLNISPKNYQYRVVGVSDQDFMILVNKINTNKIVLAMNKDGFINQGYVSGTGTESSGGSGSSESGAGSGGTTVGGSGGGCGTGSSGGGTGSSGGGTGSGGTTVEGSGGQVVANLTHTGGGWAGWQGVTGLGGGDFDFEGASGALVADGLLAAFNLLENSTAASYAYGLIQFQGISLAFATPPTGFESAGAWWDGSGIFVNTNQEGSPDSAIAALIAHEATHADFYYYPESWRDITTGRYGDVGDIHIPGNSFDQEYNAFVNEMKTWIELKGGDTNSFQDDWLAVYNQDEEYMRSEIRSTYRAAGIDLPEY